MTGSFSDYRLTIEPTSENTLDNHYPRPSHASTAQPFSPTIVCAWIAVERRILGIFLSKPSFRIAPKGKHDLKGRLAYDFERIV